MDYRQQQGVGGATVQPFSEVPSFSGPQTFQANVASGTSTAAPTQRPAYVAPDLGAEGPGPNQPPAAGSGTSRLAGVFGNSGIGAKPLQPFPTPSRPPGAVAARDYSKRSERTEQQPLRDQIGGGVTGYGDQGTNITSNTGSGSLGMEPQQQNADGFNQGPPAYDETTARDELKQTPARGPIEDQPQLGTGQNAADQQPIEETGPSHLNQESSTPQEMYDPVVQESQIGADAASGQTGETSEQDTPYADPDPASGDLRDPVEKQSGLRTSGVPGPTGSEFEQMPSDPIEVQTQLGADQATDDQVPVADTGPGEQETAYAEPGNIGTGGGGKLDEPTLEQTQLGSGGAAEESFEGAGGYQPPVDGSWDSESKPSSELHDPMLQQTPLGTEYGVQAPTGSRDVEQTPSGATENRMQRDTDQVTENRLPAENTASGQTGATQEEEPMYAEPDNIGTGVADKLADSTPQQMQFGNGTGSEVSGVVPSADPQQTATGLQSSNAYDVSDQPAPGIPNTNLPTAADRTDDTVRDETPTSEDTSVERPADLTPDTHVDNEQLNAHAQDANPAKNAPVADSLNGDELPGKLNNENELPQNAAATLDDPLTTDNDTPAPAKKGMFSSLMNKILPGGSSN